MALAVWVVKEEVMYEKLSKQIQVTLIKLSEIDIKQNALDIVEITEAQHILITNKKVTDDFEKKKREVDEAIEQLRPFVNQIRATTGNDREKPFPRATERC